jgi:hypothetical protein
MLAGQYQQAVSRLHNLGFGFGGRHLWQSFKTWLLDPANAGWVVAAFIPFDSIP